VRQEIGVDCAPEVAFAPKELKVAQDLSERLGYWTYKGRSTSRPTGLSSGRRTIIQSDQRRALMMPQELIQMPSDQLLVLRASMAPVRASKIVYWRERAFAARVAPPPVVEPYPKVAPRPPEGATTDGSRRTRRPGSQDPRTLRSGSGAAQPAEPKGERLGGETLDRFDDA
jgi:type IV secretion system protein VirD4